LGSGGYRIEPDYDPEATMAEHNAEPAASERDPLDASAAVEPVTIETLQAQLEGARVEADSQRGAADLYRDMLQRSQADYLNYKRRVEAEREGKAVAVRAEAILAFLPIVDDLERALAHLPAEVKDQGWAQGFALIERNLASLFERLSLQRIGAVGDEFDPRVHEAVAYEDSTSQPEGHVTSVMRGGYLLGERVVRPAQVAVARAPADRSGPTWPEHQTGHLHTNGGADQADLHRPRGIERSS
jgi:molecular chaperone GrpE